MSEPAQKPPTGPPRDPDPVFTQMIVKESQRPPRTPPPKPKPKPKPKE